MAVTPIQLYAAASSGSVTRQTVYTVPTGKKAIIKNIVICNYSGSALQAGVNIGKTDATTVYIVDTSIATKDTLTLDLSVVLNEGQTIQISASGSSLNFIISGVEVS